MKIKEKRTVNTPGPCECCGKPDGQNVQIKYLVSGAKKKYEKERQPFFNSDAIKNLSPEEIKKLQDDMTPGQQTKLICFDCLKERIRP
jgi:hypothetical protein